MGFDLLLKVALCVVGALFLLMPFSNRRRFREQVFLNPGFAWMAKRRPDLTERVVAFATVAWIFGVTGVVVLGWIAIPTLVAPASP
jgi:apolipoprotein N-acyltransferase